MICTYQTPLQKSTRTKYKLKYYLQTGNSHWQIQDPQSHSPYKTNHLVSLILSLDHLVKTSTALKTVALNTLSYVLTSRSLVLHIVIHLQLWQQIRAHMVFSENLHIQLSVIPLLGEDGSSGVRALIFFSSRIHSSRGESSSTCATSKTKATIFNNNIMKSQQTQTQWINQLLNTSVNVILEAWH